MATLVQLRNRILAKVADGDIQKPTAAQVTEQINLSIDFFENEAFWFNQTTAELTGTVNDPVLADIPEDFKQILEPNGIVVLVDQVRYTLQHIKPREFDNVDVGGTGIPRFYTYRDGQFLLYEYPDQAYPIFLWYQKKYADLVADGDSNDFTVYADRLIEYKTIADLLRDYRSDYERASDYDGGPAKYGRGGKIHGELLAVRNETYNRTASGILQTENIIEYNGSYLDGNGGAYN